MKIEGSTALVTGANRGLGARLAPELVQRGATKVYACARRPESLASMIAESDGVVVPIRLDITDGGQIAAAAERAGDVNLLVNNAGVLTFGGVLDGDIETVERDVAVNYLGPLRTARAFVPIIESNGGGALVNVLSIVAFGAMPAVASYSGSKAAADSMTRLLRVELAPRRIAVHAVYPASIDTDMLAGVDMPKTDPSHVAGEILDGVEAGAEEIMPEPVSAAAWDTWQRDPASIQRQFLEWGARVLWSDS